MAKKDHNSALIPVVLYDGECNFCNASVQFIIDHEKREEIQFASLQSDFGQNQLKLHGIDTNKIDSIIFVLGENSYVESGAGLKISSYLKLPYSILTIFWIIPPFIRDRVYRYIAKRRHKIVKSECRIPTESLRNRFLDI